MILLPDTNRLYIVDLRLGQGFRDTCTHTVSSYSRIKYFFGKNHISKYVKISRIAYYSVVIYCSFVMYCGIMEATVGQGITVPCLLGD